VGRGLALPQTFSEQSEITNNMKAETIWQQIKIWLRTHAPDIHDELNRGASTKDFHELEALTNIPLPQEVKEFYLIHNGQDSISDTLTEMGELLSLERMGDEWRIWKSLLDKNSFQQSQVQNQDGIAPDWWNPNWLPITYDGSGNHFCLDFAPTENGTIGQIITMWHDSGERRIVAQSFTDWIQTFADELHTGQYEYNQDLGGIFRK